MSHQVNFFLTNVDANALEAVWLGRDPIVVVHSRSVDGVPRILPSSDLEEAGRRWLFFGLLKREHLGALKMCHVPAQGYWSIDVVKSPIVEFDRCFFDGHVLRRGRLYFVDGYYDAHGSWVEKEESFRKWAKSLVASTRDRLLRHNGDYVGPEARSLLDSSAVTIGR